LATNASCVHDDGAGNSAKGPKQDFLGFMFYNRAWFNKDKYRLTLGGGKINNPGRYLVLIPPINGATAATGTPYFTANPGDPFKAWDASATFDYMPSQYITFRWEFDHRAANVPYFPVLVGSPRVRARARLWWRTFAGLPDRSCRDLCRI
jgi:hypothetical protein